jgi:transposase
MRPLQIADSAAIILGLQDEIRRSEESRYDHRLHGVLLVAQGMTCPGVAQLLGDAPRSIEYWVGRFEKEGLTGLLEGERSGRPRRLSEKQLESVDRILRRPPREAGLSGNLWDGKTLSLAGAKLSSHPGGAAMPTDLSSARLPLTKTPTGAGPRQPGGAKST